MGDFWPVEEESRNMTMNRRRSLDTFLSDAARSDHDTPSKRACYCSESLSSRVTDWLSQLPPDSPSDPDMFGKLKRDKGKGKSKSDGSSAAGGYDTPAQSAQSAQSAPSVVSGVSRPPTVASTGTYQSSSSTGRQVERQDYRRVNLMENGIEMLPRKTPLPAHVSALCNTIGKPRTSPEPTPEEAEQEMAFLQSLQFHGATEAEVEDHYKDDLFPGGKRVCKDGLAFRAKPTFQHCIPSGPSPNKVSKPIPDLVYGYTTKPEFTKFSESDRVAGQKLTPPMGEIASSGDLSFPFFVIEFKGAGPVNGNPWVATNQCLGGSATCVETAERLNRLLRQYPNAKTVDNTTFSIAMDQGMASLYVSWSSDKLKYYMRDVDYRFDLENPEKYVLFRRYVKNILDWGKGPRLREIQEAFDFLLEEDRKRASAQARQRPPPSTSGTPSSKRPAISQAGSPSVASRVSSSRTQSDRNDRPARTGPLPTRQPGYQSPSAASDARSYQSGSYAGGGGSRASSGAGSRVGRDRSPRPPESRPGNAQSRPPAGPGHDGRHAPPPPQRPSGSPPRPANYAPQRLNPPSRDARRGGDVRRQFPDAYDRRL
ncbi:hypothetical protein PG985_003783 [Apiospora marii]|uniref:DUF7924 domain-containing protein n=1 Tax=Apiospora marii TaxID=335849 RepID=A0ABR1SH84_9PEZI